MKREKRKTERITVCIDCRLTEAIDTKILEGKFRSRTHAVEDGLKKLINSD